MIELRTADEIEQMKPAGRFVADVLTRLEQAADVGVNLMELDNALNTAAKELAQRYDFRGTNTAIERGPEDVHDLEGLRVVGTVLARQNP